MFLEENLLKTKIPNVSFSPDTKDEESDNEENSQEDEDTIIKPKRNAFALLDHDDDEDED